MNGNWIRYIENQCMFLYDYSQIHIFEPQILIYELEESQNFQNMNQNFFSNNCFFNNNNFIIPLNQFQLRQMLMQIGNFNVMLKNYNFTKDLNI